MISSKPSAYGSPTSNKVPIFSQSSTNSHVAVPAAASNVGIFASVDDNQKIPHDDFPQTLSVSMRARVTVPMPRETVPIWTEDITVFFDAPRSFTSLMTLPNPQEDPAFYAAACDTIRSSNWRLDAHGPYPQQLQKSHVRKLKKDWRASYPDETKYPFPPDPRDLYVKLNGAHPLDDDEGVRNTSWARACEEFHWIKGDPFTKSSLLRKTRNDHIRENRIEGESVEGQDKLQVRIYVRYLVWREHTASKKDITTDSQPSRRELTIFFDKAENQKNGATLADICHEFPDARDMQMLVYRIEQLATFTPKLDTKEHPIESVYIPRQKPAALTKKMVKDAVEEIFAEASVLPIAVRTQIPTALDPFAVTHHHAILQVIQNMTKVSQHGQTIALITYKGPSIEHFYTLLGQMNGYSLDSIQDRFTDYLFEIDDFMEPLFGLLYEDDADGLMYCRHVVDGEWVYDDNRNKELRLRARLQHMVDSAPKRLSDMLDSVAIWDAVTGQYVRKTEPTVAVTPPPVVSAAASAPSGARKRSRSNEPMEAGPLSPKRPRNEETQPGEDNVKEIKKQCYGITRQKKRCKLQGRCSASEDYYCSKHKGS
ncbi:hypothetical protein J1614_010118 [Plenodomus biglobosus]|nr:hypothetical protein J1614_010118 [Plenodomus biglobosus]